MVEADQIENIEFKWGKKRRVGGRHKNYQFYESFTYDGVDYTLYDNVYMYKEGETEPYIGKLIKIWEHPDKTKKSVKLLWFFRPHEISNYLGAERPLENELFLASGEGAGLTNINPLEAIAGKCNVVCISKDSRNPQPSDEELQKADFVFYRTFDVGSHRILSEIDEKIYGIDIEVKFLLNRVDDQKPSSFSKLEKNAPGEFTTVDSSIDTRVKENAYSKVLLPEQRSLFGEKPASHVVEQPPSIAKIDHADTKALVMKQTSDFGVKVASDVGVQCGEAAKTNGQQVNIFSDKASSNFTVKEISDTKPSLVRKESSLRENFVSDLGVDLGEMTKNIKKEKLISDKIASMSKDDAGGSKNKVGKGPVNQVRVEEKVKAAKDFGDLDDRPFKKAKLDNSANVSYDNKVKSLQKFRNDSIGSSFKAVAQTTTASEDRSKLKLSNGHHMTDNGLSMKPKSDEKLTRLGSGKFSEASLRRPLRVGSKANHQPQEATRRPEDRSKWFKKLPWEERIRTAHEQGTLVLLENLDPSYTSAEVEDIVWHAFKQSCSAKMIQKTALSSPHSGQALVIFQKREVAELVVQKLDEGCFWLSTERPLVGSIATHCLPGKPTTFFGHLVIDKLRFNMQREMKEAVSTSHCSQPNTIEYDMAMEWCLLQDRSDLALKNLHEQQGQELTKIMATRKSK